MKPVPIGQRIKEARKQKGIGQAALAAAIGLKQPSLSEIENSKTVPRRGTLQLIAIELSSDLGELWLRNYLNKRPKSRPAELVEEIAEMAGDNEWILGVFVVRLAKRLPLFAELLDQNKYPALEKQMSALEKLVELIDIKPSEVPTEQFGRILEDSGYLVGLDDEGVGPLKPADMILALDMGTVDGGEDKEVKPSRKKTG